MGEKKNSKEIMENILKRVTSTESRLMEIEQYTQNSNETIVLNMQENLNKLEKSSNDRATDLENTVIKYYEQIGVNKDNIKQINQLTTELGINLHSLNVNLEESINAQKLFETHQNEFNKASDMQMKAELERFDRVESHMNNSIQNLTKQYTEVDNKIVTILNDKFTNLQTIIESYESKNKDTIHNMHDLTDRTSSIEKILESKVPLLDEKCNEHSNRINSLQESNMLQNQKVGNVEGLSDKVNHIEDNMKGFEENYNSMMISINKYETRSKKIDDSMMAIMEQGNTTLINDAQQDSKIKTLEIQNRSLEDKLSSLESADLFLQESYRQLTDKTVKIETDFRKTDDNLNFLYKQQHEEIEGKIKAQITDLYFEVNELQQEKIGLNEKLDEMENNMGKNLNVIGAMERNIPEIIKKINIDVQDKIRDFKDSNATDIEQFVSNIEKQNNSRSQILDTKLIEVDAGNQQLLEKLLGIEEDLDGKLQNINENNKVIVAQMNILEERNQGDNNQNQEQIRTLENNFNKLARIKIPSPANWI